MGSHEEEVNQYTRTVEWAPERRGFGEVGWYEYFVDGGVASVISCGFSVPFGSRKGTGGPLVRLF